MIFLLLVWFTLWSISLGEGDNLSDLMDTVEGRDVILLYFFLKKELPYHKLSFWGFVNSFVVDVLFYLFELLLVANIAV